MPAPLQALLPTGTEDRSVLIGAPEDFDLLECIRHASSVCLAMAFGHMSGWSEIRDALSHSTAQSVRILLGRAFYRTEPKLLLELKKKQQQAPPGAFDVRVASVVAIFHPKVWIVRQQQDGIAIVGSGNLSGPGLSHNIECALYTNQAVQVATVQEWFDHQWANGSADAKVFDEYIKKHQEIALARKLVDDKIDHVHREAAMAEAAWRKKQALGIARQYWQTPAGQQAVHDRDTALQNMRTILDYPMYQFSTTAWVDFLHIPELGRIRINYQTIPVLPQLQEVLRDLTTGALPFARAVDDLQKVPGIGRNIATKLLALDTPSKYVVVNGPVERALRAFGYSLTTTSSLAGKEYAELLRELNRFIEEAESLGLQAATALDAFFYAYKDADPNTTLQDFTVANKP